MDIGFVKILGAKNGQINMIFQDILQLEWVIMNVV